MFKVSIIIPIYKVESYIERCITSVLRQTYRNLEVILVDDCSPDHSMEIAKKVINENEMRNSGMSFVFLKHEHNRGLSAARNTGINAATGDYLYFLDSDDEITDECVEKLVKEAEEGGYDAICGNFQFEDGGLNLNNLPTTHWELKSYDRDEILRHLTDGFLFIMACNKLVRRELITTKSLYFKEGIIHEDELWTYLLVNQITSMCVIPDGTYIYWRREGSVTISVSKRKRFNSMIIILKEFQKQLKKGMIRDNPVNHAYMMEQREKWMIEIFSSNELLPLEEIKYLLSIVCLEKGIWFSVKFLYSRIMNKIKY